MRCIGAMLAFLCVAGASTPSEKSGLCLKHVESPEYSAVARAAHVDGDVTLDVAVDAEGKVINVEFVSGARVLADGAIENVRRWTFKNPNRDPSSQRVTYEYRIEGMGGEMAVSTVSFDFPDQVKVVVNPLPINRD
jgi:TonB family protein